jgi:hypothetical protein
MEVSLEIERFLQDDHLFVQIVMRRTMKKKFLSLLMVLLVSVLMVSSVSAGGAVKLSGATFQLSSLIATGTFTGLGGYKDGVTVELTASGIPVVTCTNQGGNQAPGQNPPKVTANGIQEIPSDLITKKGTAPLNVTAKPDPILTGTQGGCPNDNWSAVIDFVFWTNATITVTDNVTGYPLLTQDYTCVTTRNPDNSGTVSCTLVQ